MASAQAPIEDLQCRKMAKKFAQLDKPSGLAAKEKKIRKAMDQQIFALPRSQWIIVFILFIFIKNSN